MAANNLAMHLLLLVCYPATAVDTNIGTQCENGEADTLHGTEDCLVHAVQMLQSSSKVFTTDEDLSNHSSQYCPLDTGGSCTYFACSGWRNAVCQDSDRRRASRSSWLEANRRRQSCVCAQGLCSVDGKCQAPDEEPTCVQEGEDSLTVLMFNTYLVDIPMVMGMRLGSTAEALDQRPHLIAEWILSLGDAMPDVLVLNEIYSDAGEQLVQSLCTEAFQRRESVFHGFCDEGDNCGPDKPTYPITPCKDESPFSHTTLVNNARFDLHIVDNALKSGGVVVLVKKGLTMDMAYDETFEDLRGEQQAGNKGFWAARAWKGCQPFWIIGTHTMPYASYYEARHNNFKQIRTWIDGHIPDKCMGRPCRVVYAGDMNIVTDTFTSDAPEDKGTTYHPETEQMLEYLGQSADIKADTGTLVPEGFWLKLNSTLDYTWHTETNHYVQHKYAPGTTYYEGEQVLDWVLVPGQGDRFDHPNKFERQHVPVLASTCFETKFDESGIWVSYNTTELSDHYGVFAQLCWSDECTTKSVEGHRGVDAGIVPSPVDSPADKC